MLPRQLPSKAMKWRVIIRVGFSDDRGSGVRNWFAKLCGDCDIRQTPTGTWESPAADPVRAAQTLSEVLKGLANRADKYSRNMEHLWVYLDRVKDDEKTG